MAAIIAAKFHSRLVCDVEPCGHRLVVGNALWIRATDYSRYHVGQVYRAFFHHFVVAYYVDYGCGGYYGYAVKHVLREFRVGHLDDSFGAKASAGKIVAYGDAFVH